MKTSPIRIKPFRGSGLTAEEKDLEEFIKSLEYQSDKSLDDLVSELEQEVNPTASESCTLTELKLDNIDDIKDYLAIFSHKRAGI